MRAGEADECSALPQSETYCTAAAVGVAAAATHTGTAMRDAGEASDEALMIAYREGDALAFELLYGRHRGGLYRFLLRQCGTAAIAEELFQDVWLNLIRARARYVPDARFATYLDRIAHNRLIDYFRRSSHRPRIESDEEQAEAVASVPADPRDQPEIRLERQVRVERFMLLLAGLPDAQREAFVMHQEAGLSIEEIAEATGVNVETAKSRLRYAVSKLRRGLQELM